MQHGSFIADVQQALRGGVQAIQLREKDLDTRDLLKLAYRMRKVTVTHKAKLFINDRFDIALSVDADGVHLTQKSIPVEAVRKVVGKEMLIGVSTHSLKEAKEAEKGGADFITFGPVYRTPSKVAYGPPVGLDALEKVSGKLSIPVFALGGITISTIRKALDSGAHGVSMISEVFTAEDIREKTKKIMLTLN